MAKKIKREKTSLGEIDRPEKLKKKSFPSIYILGPFIIIFSIFFSLDCWTAIWTCRVNERDDDGRWWWPDGPSCAPSRCCVRHVIWAHSTAPNSCHRDSSSSSVRVVTQQVAFSKGAQEKERKTQRKFVTSGQSSLFDDLLVRVFLFCFFLSISAFL